MHIEFNCGYGSNGGYTGEQSNRGRYHGTLYLPRSRGGAGSMAGQSTLIRGGSKIEVKAAQAFVLEGQMSVNGQSTTNGNGGGSGGAILIVTHHISGHGTLSSVGGAGGNGGSGGRIALYTNQTSAFQGMYNAYGGSGSSSTCQTCHGAPGSVYTHQVLSSNTSTDGGDDTDGVETEELLIIDGAGRSWSNNYYVLDEKDENATDSTHVTTLQEVNLINGAALQLPSDGRNRSLSLRINKLVCFPIFIYCNIKWVVLFGFAFKSDDTRANQSIPGLRIHIYIFIYPSYK
ncbi:uncharacterized protein LOC144747121 [Ciona intestinalis]